MFNLLLLQLLLIVSIPDWKSSAKAEKMTYQTCTNTLLKPETQPKPELDCQPRDVLVNLDLPDNRSYFHVAPDQVIVKRCGGSCHFDNHKSCVSTTEGTQMKTVSVWLYPVSSDPGVVAAECAVVNIKEHTECICGCAETPESCKPNQRFQESQCSCACSDQAAKLACISKSWNWNEPTCQCTCKHIY